MTIDEQKKELRKRVRMLKQQFSLEEKQQKSESIWQQLELTPEFISAKTIMLYWSMDDEVYTHSFVRKWYQKKEIILPIVNGDDLELCIFSGDSCLVPGDRYGILEPNGERFSEKHKIDLIVVPGVAFDKQNNRMGRGKAYYDKLLKTTNAYKIGVCFDFQLFDIVPHDENDVKMDKVVGERC